METALAQNGPAGGKRLGPAPCGGSRATSRGAEDAPASINANGALNRNAAIDVDVVIKVDVVIYAAIAINAAVGMRDGARAWGVRCGGSAGLRAGVQN